MSFKSLVAKLMKEGKSKESATKIAGSVANAKMHGAGSGPTAAQSARSAATQREVTKGKDEFGNKVKTIRKRNVKKEITKVKKERAANFQPIEENPIITRKGKNRYVKTTTYASSARPLEENPVHNVKTKGIAPIQQKTPEYKEFQSDSARLQSGLAGNRQDMSHIQGKYPISWDKPTTTTRNTRSLKFLVDAKQGYSGPKTITKQTNNMKTNQSGGGESSTEAADQLKKLGSITKQKKKGYVKSNKEKKSEEKFKEKELTGWNPREKPVKSDTTITKQSKSPAKKVNSWEEEDVKRGREQEEKGHMGHAEALFDDAHGSYTWKDKFNSKSPVGQKMFGSEDFYKQHKTHDQAMELYSDSSKATMDDKTGTKKWPVIPEFENYYPGSTEYKKVKKTIAEKEENKKKTAFSTRGMTEQRKSPTTQISKHMTK